MTSFDFSFSRFTFSSSKKLNFLIQSNIRQVPNILVFLISCTRPTSFAWLSGRTLSLLQPECSREEECFGPGEEFLGAQSTTIFFFFLINGSSKESKPSEAHPRIFLLSLLLLPMTRVNPIELFFYGRFRLLLIEQKSLRQSQLTVLHETMSTSWKLRRKSLTVIIVFLVEDSKDEKNLLAGLNLHYVDVMALNDDEKGLSIELFGLYLLDDLLGIRKCRICLSEEIYS